VTRWTTRTDADPDFRAILYAALTQDPNFTGGVRNAATTGIVIVAGEITTKATVDYAQVGPEAIL